MTIAPPALSSTTTIASLLSTDTGAMVLAFFALGVSASSSRGRFDGRVATTTSSSRSCLPFTPFDWAIVGFFGLRGMSTLSDETALIGLSFVWGSLLSWGQQFVNSTWKRD